MGWRPHYWDEWIIRKRCPSSNNHKYIDPGVITWQWTIIGRNEWNLDRRWSQWSVILVSRRNLPRGTRICCRRGIWGTLGRGIEQWGLVCSSNSCARWIQRQEIGQQDFVYHLQNVQNHASLFLVLLRAFCGYVCLLCHSSLLQKVSWSRSRYDMNSRTDTSNTWNEKLYVHMNKFDITHWHIWHIFITI